MKKGTGIGSITTWLKVGEHYTHVAERWHRKAFFKAHVDSGQLRFNIIAPKGKNVTNEVYAYYHGHLTETFLNHFDKDFSLVGVSPLCTAGDVCKAA